MRCLEIVSSGKTVKVPVVTAFLLFLLLLSGGPARASITRAQAAKTGAPFMVYIPDGLDSTVKHPCVIALSPNGRGERALAFMKAACDRYQWILVSPENRGRAVQFLALDQGMRDTIETAVKSYPIDTQRIIAGGYAGGGMEAHHLSVICPDFIKGVIANCGIIHADGMRLPNYAKGKFAVLLTNADDFRYMQMKQNADFLTENRWQVAWMEFSGGHRWAPPAVYLRAFGWLDQRMNASLNPDVTTSTLRLDK
jgi:predicted esterase